MSIGSLALTWLLHQDGAPPRPRPAKPTLERPVYDLKPKAPAAPAAGPGDDLAVHAGRAQPPRPVRPQARARPKRDGKTFTGDIKYDNAGEASAKLFASPWKFRKHGAVRHGAERAAARPGRGRRRHHAWSARCTPA